LDKLDKSIYRMEDELINYLYSHIEWEHIEMDMKEKYNTDKLENLSKEQLLTLANLYDY
jgi:hypothetical protein